MRGQTMVQNGQTMIQVTTIGFPPIKQPLALEAEATRFWVPQENGAEKGENSVMSYLYVKWNSLEYGSPADDSAISAWFVLRWPLP